MNDALATTTRTRLPRPTGASEEGRKLWRLAGGLTIRERLNSSGSVSYRLEIPAKVAGQRRMVQFKSFAEAQQEAADTLANKEQFGRAGFQLNRQQIDDALRARTILQPFNVSLTEVAEYFAKHEKPERGDITFSALVDVFIEEKRKGTAAKRGLPLRERSLSDLECRLGLFARVHGDTLVKSLREDTVKAWLFADESLAPQTRVNHFRNLRNLFNFAVKRRYIAESPLARIQLGAESKAPGILTIDQAGKLLLAALQHPEMELLPYVALGLFCGVRSEELSKLEWRHVNMTTGLVTIPSEIAKKRRIRNFTMPDCCRTWLNASGTAREGRIQPIGFNKRFRKLVAHAGISHWPHNALRHCAASYHYQKHGNASLTCSMLGQRSDDVLFTHYRSLVTPEDAEHFYRLLPPAAGNVLQMAS